MPTIRLEAQVSPDDLLRAVAQLSPSELQQFISRVMALRAQRAAPQLSATESQLMSLINQGLPADSQRRYAELAAKRDAETLTTEEHAELLQLTDTAEQLQSERARALVDLAQRRQVPVATLMEQLGIRVPSDG